MNLLRLNRLLYPFRIAIFIFAGVAAIWAWAIGAIAITNWSTTAIGERIRQGQSFSAQALEPFVKDAILRMPDSECSTHYLRGRVTILAAWTADAESRLDLDAIDARLAQLEANSRTLLACQPYDSFGWLMLYWAAGHRHGFTDDSLAYLVMSYRTGPREAWISTARNRLAALAFERLPLDVQDLVVAEWGLLVQGLLFDAAASTLQILPRAHHDRLFEQRHRIRPSAYARFGHFLDARGSDVTVPAGPFLRRRSFVR